MQDNRAAHLDKTLELLDRIKAELLVDCAKLLNSGAIDPENFDESEFVLAKILVSAALERNTKIVFPLHKDNQKLVKQLTKV